MNTQRTVHTIYFLCFGGLVRGGERGGGIYVFGSCSCSCSCSCSVLFLRLFAFSLLTFRWDLWKGRGAYLVGVMMRGVVYV